MGASWISRRSDEEIVYPIESEEAELARANVTTGEVVACPDCSMNDYADALIDEENSKAAGKHEAGKIEAVDLPEGAELVAGSANGALGVYVKDDEEVLSLMYKQAGRPVQVLFDNKREWVRPESGAVED